MKHLLVTTIAALVLVGFSLQQQSAMAQQSSVSETASPESVDSKNNDSKQIVMNGVKFVFIMLGAAGLLYVYLKYKLYAGHNDSSE